ncbi:hypothetical protein Droror1_Dr00011837 [Drosera rotundifolia]
MIQSPNSDPLSLRSCGPAALPSPDSPLPHFLTSSLPLFLNPLWNRQVKLEFNSLDSRSAACLELLAQCNSCKAKESNPSCLLEVKRRTNGNPPRINVTFVNGVEEVFDAAMTSAQSIREMILKKGRLLETEQMFRDAGETWPVLIPEEELRIPAPGIKVTALPNLYGVLVKNTAAGTAGGSGVMPGGNVGADPTVFEQDASAGMLELGK